jgi:hypothetical protein
MKSRWRRRNCLTSPTSTPQSATVRVPARGRQGGPAERRTLQPHGDAKQLTPAAILICVAGRILEAAWKEAEQAAAALERSKVLHAARTALARAGVGFVPRANHSLQITPSAPSGGRWQSVAPPLPSCTNWTSLVPPLVLTGQASSLPVLSAERGAVAERGGGAGRVRGHRAARQRGQGERGVRPAPPLPYCCPYPCPYCTLTAGRRQRAGRRVQLVREGGTRRVHFLREGGGGGGAPRGHPASMHRCSVAGARARACRMHRFGPNGWGEPGPSRCCRRAGRFTGARSWSGARGRSDALRTCRAPRIADKAAWRTRWGCLDLSALTCSTLMAPSWSPAQIPQDLLAFVAPTLVKVHGLSPSVRPFLSSGSCCTESAKRCQLNGAC